MRTALAAFVIAPTLLGANALGNAKIQLQWTGVHGAVARIKRDDYRLDPHHVRWINVPNLGSVVLANQPLGLHFYRVCDVSTATVRCSTPDLVDVR